MATIKGYTDLEQSRKLAEILPFESADMIYTMVNGRCTPFIRIETIEEMDEDDVLCWSLAALFGTLPLINFTRPLLIGTPKTLYKCMYNDDLKSHAYDNPVDACYEMIIRLNELNLL